MGVRDLDALAPRSPASFTDRAVGTTPADKQQLGVSGRIVDLQIGTAMPSIFAWRNRTIRSWLTGS